MFAALFDSLLKHVIIPEVAGIVRRRLAAGLEDPANDAEVVAEFFATRDRIVAKGDAFLARTEPAPPAED